MQPGVFNVADKYFNDTAIITEESKRISYKDLWGYADHFSRNFKTVFL